MWKDDLPRTFPKGSELTNRLVDAIVRELWRWRKVQASPPLAIDYTESSQPPVFSYHSQDGDDNRRWAVTLSSIAAGSLASPTQGTATLYKDNGSGLVADKTAYVYNVYGSTIASGKTVWVETYAGKLYILTADC